MNSSPSSGHLWQLLFYTIYKLLEEDKSPQMYHTHLFLKNELHHKLVYFILDANAENFYIDQASCHAFMQIFAHFASIFSASTPRPAALSYITPSLFDDFAKFLYILHPDNNVYIVNQKSEFYFNITLSVFFFLF